MQRNLYIFYFDEIEEVKEAILKTVVVGIDAGSDIKVPVKIFFFVLFPASK